MSNFVYRFRTIKALLGEREELAKQFIYFASLQQLNDPMEGFRNVVWHGDGILWRNLFRNYARTFHAAHMLAGLLHGEPVEDWMKCSINSAFHMPEAPIRAELDKVAETFVNRPEVRKLAANLADRLQPIRRGELLFFLRLLHQINIKISADALTASALPGILNVNDELVQQATTHIESILSFVLDPFEFNEDLCDVSETLNQQIQLINATAGVNHQPAALFLGSDFSPRFIEALIAMPYPDWHVACFVENPDNATMWSAYADNHAGVCLKFRTGRTSDLRRTLTLNGQRSWSSTENGATVETRSFGPLAFSPVHYDGGYPEIPFFTSLGQFPLTDLNRQWYSEGDEISPAANAITGDSTQWREAYWNKFDRCVNRKTSHWAHERELRLTLVSGIQPFDTPETRCLNYRFEDLAGIVFGVKTSTKDKIDIIKIIQHKCQLEGRADFEFHQAVYSKQTLNIETQPLSLIKIGRDM